MTLALAIIFTVFILVAPLVGIKSISKVSHYDDPSADVAVICLGGLWIWLNILNVALWIAGAYTS